MKGDTWASVSITGYNGGSNVGSTGSFNPTSGYTTINLGWNNVTHITASVSGNGLFYLEDMIYTVDPVLPTVSTNSATLVAPFSATLNGNVTADGDATILERGFYHSTTNNFTPPGEGTKVSKTGTTGAFNHDLSGLSEQTNYYYKAYARNSVGTTYASQRSFYTPSSNAAPTAANFTVSPIYQNTVYAFATADFSYNDGDADPINHLRITTIPGDGILFMDANDDDLIDGGETLSNGNTISKANLDAGRLKYLSVDGNSSSFIFDVNDGTDYSALTYTSTLTVTPKPTVTLELAGSPIDENGGVATVTARLSHTFDKIVIAHLVLSGSAQPADYTLSASQIDVAIGSTTGSITVTGDNDFDVEGDETLTLEINTVSDGTEDGDQEVTVTITDDDVVPTLTTTAISAITTTTASTGGNITSQGGAAVTARGVVWSKTTTPELTVNEDGKTTDGTGSGNFTSSISTLEVNTLYYVRAYATNIIGDGYGNQVSFTTLAIAPTAPTVNNPSSTTLDVTINENGNPGTVVYAIEEVGSGDYVQADGTLLNGSTIWQTAATWGTKTVTGLTPGTVYNFRVKAKNSANTETVFSPSAGEQTYQQPSATTQAVTDIENVTATGNGNITFLGIPDATQHGICWSTSTAPTIDDMSDFKTEEGVPSSTGAFTSNMTGLIHNTHYYVRAYATNSAGTVYGNEVEFDTEEEYSEIELRYSGSEVTLLSGLDLGEANRGESYTFDFSIFNVGQYSDLTIAPSAVAITGADAAKFSVTAQPATTVTAGNNTTFTVTYTPTVQQTDNATLTVTNSETLGTDVTNEQAYQIYISIAAVLDFITIVEDDVEFRYEPSDINAGTPNFVISTTHDMANPIASSVSMTMGSSIAKGTIARNLLASDGTVYYVRYDNGSGEQSNVWSFELSPAVDKGIGVIKIGG
jgi:hypothetical protein